MSKSKDPSITISNSLCDSLRKVILTIPRAKRKEISSHITELQKAFNIDGDLINYTAQGKHWAERPPEVIEQVAKTQQSKIRAYQEQLKKERAEAKAASDRKYKVEWWGQGHRICTLAEAAAIVKISEHALRLRLHKSKNGRAAFNIEEEVVTVYKPKA